MKKISLLISVLLVLALLPLAFAECREDFVGDNINVSSLAQTLVQKGQYEVFVYGFDSDDADEGLLRAEPVVEQLKDFGITATPFLGLRAPSNISSNGNDRVVVSADQIFPSNFTPAPPIGKLTECSVVQFCNETKLYRGKWYCLLDSDWFGPCEYNDCIGDVNFFYVEPHMQEKLKNIIGEDVDSLNKAISGLSARAALLANTRNNIMSAELYQEAFEISLRSGDINGEALKTERDRQFYISLDTAKTADEASRLLSLVHRTELSTPHAPLIVSQTNIERLESLTAPGINWILISLWLIVIIALLLMATILIHLLTAATRSHRRLLDDAAKDILIDIDELELSLIRKKMLVDDYKERLEDLQ